ncbi:hypothetical protein ACFYWU_34435 [Streptomyces chrestomyceticus]|uniref:hypothetical protein n=1 Tax=Streptomyces chrestomyceticus TaxID=68185 RepID=UPI0036B046D1
MPKPGTDFTFGREWPYRFWNGPRLQAEHELGDDQEALSVADRMRKQGEQVTRIERCNASGHWTTVWTAAVPYPGNRRAAA